MSANFQRILRIHNPNYRRDGLKSYVWLLRKYNITPTLPGPYYVEKKEHTEKIRAGNQKYHKHHQLRKHHAHSEAATTGTPSTTTPATGTGTTVPSGTKGGEVPADDQQNDSEYLCPVQIGTPAQTLNLDFDTGSSDLWVWSTELGSTVSTTGHNVFDASKSSTFKLLSGSTWTISYGDGSSASGNVGTDVVNLGGVEITGQGVEEAEKLSSAFTQNAGDGLLGLAWGNINTVKPTPVATPVSNMISQSSISQPLFTAKLGSYRDANDPDKGASFYTFGYIDETTLNGETPTYTPVDNSQGFWSIQSGSYSVNGTTYTPNTTTAIMDTGTTLALVDDATVENIYNAIPGAGYDSSQQGYTFPASTTADQLPQVQFAIGSTLFDFQKEDLGFASAGTNSSGQQMVYGSIQSAGDMGMNIFGDAFLKSLYAIFDQGNQRFGAVQRTEPTQNTSPPPSS
ncbi:MAG: hypothetical protein M1822_000407 [Bathelium mastoideum]|nr:MAG: hypothetical protein M1822_000407 [Bathelium mastoideum]